MSIGSTYRMTAEFIEKDNGIIRTFQYCPASSIEFKTRKQDVKILDTMIFGKTLFIDGVLQSSVRDEGVYHSALVSTVMERTPCVKNVCIIGGGEGATAREVLKWDSVERIDMIDWDQELVEFFRDFETDWHKGALRNPKVNFEYSDIFTVASEKRAYDVIIVDLTDPDMNDPRWITLLSDIAKWMNPNGSFIMNAGGVLPWDLGSVPQIEKTLSKHFPVTTFKMFVPSFGREWAFVMNAT